MSWGFPYRVRSLSRITCLSGYDQRYPSQWNGILILETNTCDYITLYYLILSYIIIFYYIILILYYYIILYYIILYYIILHYIILHYIIAYYVMLCYVMLYYIFMWFVLFKDNFFRKFSGTVADFQVAKYRCHHKGICDVKKPSALTPKCQQFCQRLPSIK